MKGEVGQLGIPDTGDIISRTMQKMLSNVGSPIHRQYGGLRRVDGHKFIKPSVCPVVS